MRELIEQKQYFVIHAARQTGKTTLLKELSQQLNRQGEYYTLYCSLESVQEITELEKGIPAIFRTLKRYAEMNPVFRAFRFGIDADLTDFNNVLIRSLSRFCGDLDKPLVIFFDEADCLSNGALIIPIRFQRSVFHIVQRFFKPLKPLEKRFYG